MEQTKLAEQLNVIYQPHPIAPLYDRKGMVVVTDGTATVREVLLTTGVDPYQPITIQLDGELLTVEQWDTICPAQGQMLSVHGTVQGGGGGSNVLQIVAVIAIAVAVAVVAGPIGVGFFAGAGFGTGVVAAAVASATIAVAGSLLIGALFAPKPPTMPNAPAAVSPTYSLSGGQNRARPYEPMPVVMGAHRLFLDYASRPFTEYRGNDQYLYQIFNLGLGNISANNYKIGTTDINSYIGYQFVTPDSNGRLANFPGNVDTSAGAALTFSAGWIERTTSINTYQIGIDLEAILFRVDNKGNVIPVTTNLEIEYKLTSSPNWTPAANPTIFGNWITHLGGSAYLMRAGSQSQQRATILFSVPVGTYDVRIRRVDPADNVYGSEGRTDTNWSVLRSYQQDDSDYKGQNRIGLIIKATEQLNGVVQQLSAQVTAQATYWNGTAWVTGATSNPAHWFMHFARGVYNTDGKLMYGIGLSDSQIDLASLSAWASFCATEGLTFNAVIDTNITAAEVLTMLGTAGFGSPSWASGKLGVIFDARNASPVMAFGMSNIIRDSFEVAYISENLAEEIVIRFSNPAKDYEQDEVRTLAPGVVTPSRTSAIDLFGCTNATMAGKFANYVAAQQYYRRRRVTWQSDFEGFVCQRGDVVLLSHDLTQWGYSGRFVAVNGNVLTLDRSVPRQNQIEYLMLIRPDGTTTTYDVVPSEESESDTLTLVDEFVLFQEGADLIDHRWCFSPLATPGKKLKILSVQPASDARLQIVATDEFSEFYDAWNGTFVAPVADTILPSQPISVVNLTLSTRVAFVNGYLTNRALASWNVGGGTLYNRVRWYLDGTLIQEINQTQIQSAEIDINGAGVLLVEVTPYGVTGAGITQTATLTLTALDFPAPPTTVTLEVGEDGKAATYTWTPVLGALAYVIEVFSGGVVKRTINVGNTLSYTYTLEQAQADGGAFRSYDFRVYAVNQAGQSTTFALASFSNPQIGQLQNAAVEPMPNSIWFKADRPTETDFAAIRVWVSKTSGFTPSDSTLAYDGANTFVTVSADADGNPLESGVVYYVRAAAYDTFGDDNLTLTAELSATILSPAWGLLQNDIETSMLESGLRDRIDLIDTSGDPDFPTGLIDGFRQTNTEVTILDDAVNEVGQKLLESALKVQENTDLLYDAGVTVDSTTGEVYIFAVREAENRLDSAEIRLDAAESNINLRATTVYVDNAIATAVIDPSQIAELGDLQARIGQAEIDIDGLDAAVSIKADLTVVNSQGARLTTAEADIDALEGEIVLKANNTDLTATDVRVTNVESTLNALDVPSITQSVQDVKFVQRNQDQIAETQLRDILTGEAHFDDLNVGIAKAEQRLTAYTDGLIFAEATARLELSADLGNTNAALEQESIARATADGALSSQITTLQSTVGNNTTAIQTTASTVDGIQGKYTVKIDNNGYVSGYGLISTANNAVPFADFQVIADRFAIAPVATDPDVVDGSPFFVLTSSRVINGVTVAPGTYIKQANIYDASITTAKINDLAVTNAKIANAAIDDAKITTATITGAKIASATITDANIANATITEAKIQNAAITEAKIANLAVGRAKIQDAAINEAKIENLAVTEAKINNAAITNAKIANLAVNNAKIADLSVTEGKIANLSVSTLKIQGNAVTVPINAEASNVIPGNGGYQNIISATITASGGVNLPIVLLFSARVGYFAVSNVTTGYRILKNGSVIGDFGFLNAILDFPSFQYFDVLGANQTATYTIQWYGINSNVQMAYRGLTLFGAKR